MIKVLPKSTVYAGIKKLLFLTLILYSGVTTFLLFRLDPKPLIIGIDPYGTRVLGAEKDPILKAEKENFLKRFVTYLYNYDETNFDERISIVGDFMNSKIWERRKAEFTSVSNRLKQEPLTQKGKITDLREIDETHFEADVEVHVQSRLRESTVKMRVEIELAAAPRTSSKPYPWEVTSYDEQTAN